MSNLVPMQSSWFYIGQVKSQPCSDNLHSHIYIMCVCMYVYIYVYVCIYICVCVYKISWVYQICLTFILKSTQICINFILKSAQLKSIYWHICVSICIYVCIYIMCVYIYISSHTHICQSENSKTSFFRWLPAQWWPWNNVRVSKPW